RFSASGMVPPGPGYIEGTRPYFFRVGQSDGPIRSKPLIPSRAASRQLSSSAAPRPNTPLVTPCLIRPLRCGGVAGGCASCPDMPPTMSGAVTAPRNSLRRIVPSWPIVSRRRLSQIAKSRTRDQQTKFVFAASEHGRLYLEATEGTENHKTVQIPGPLWPPWPLSHASL